MADFAFGCNRSSVVALALLGIVHVCRICHRRYRFNGSRAQLIHCFASIVDALGCAS